MNIDIVRYADNNVVKSNVSIKEDEKKDDNDLEMGEITQDIDRNTRDRYVLLHVFLHLLFAKLSVD